MAEVEEEIGVETIYCYCCEDFTEHLVYPQPEDEKIIYQCKCGCEVDTSEDDIIRPDDKTVVDEAPWMTVDQLAKAIRDWCYDAGEDFTDYFMDDNVNNRRWLYWLVGKGHKEHALPVLAQIEANAASTKWSYISQGEMFEVYPDDYEGPEVDKLDGTTEKMDGWDMNSMLYAEFLLDFPDYTEKVKAFLADSE